MTFVVETPTLFDTGKKVRKCKCGCGRSLEGFHGKREIHPDCEERCDRLRREARRRQIEEERKARAEEKFLKFHRENPHVYRIILEKTWKLWHAGHRHHGMKAIFESIRWDQKVGTISDDFKLNNNFTPFYARLIMENEPKLRGFFQTRENNGKRNEGNV